MSQLSFLRLAQGYSLMLTQEGGPQRPRVESLIQASVAGDAGVALRVLYPADLPSGGTWVGVNDRGAAFALLGEASALVLEALRAASAGGGLERVAAIDLSSTAPFQLVGFEDGQAPLSLRWDGQALERRLHPDGSLLLSNAKAWPEPAERSGGEEPALLAAQEAYHLEHWGEALSFTQVLVLPKLVVLRYLDRTAREAGQEAEMVSLQRLLPNS